MRKNKRNYRKRYYCENNFINTVLDIIRDSFLDLIQDGVKDVI